jgi:PTS system arbutin-like IIC component
MMQKLQRFGAAMFTPVLLFSFGGIMTAICILMTNQQVMGSIASPGTNWYGVWNTLQAGAFTVFSIIPILFVVGLPIGLAKTASGRAAMESVVLYATWNFMINGILTNFGKYFGLANFAKIQIVANSTNSGLTNIMGIKTLDTSILGALVVAGITVWLHNKYFNKKLPDWLGTFQGSAYIVILGYFVMIPLAILTCWLWPQVQGGISALEGFMKNSGVLGVGVYSFLERLLIPTGLHHFIYIPFMYGPAVVPGGLRPWWFANLQSIATSTRPLKELAPGMGFALYGHEKVFGILGICLAFYFTAKPEKKKQTLALLIPAALTAVMAGITEPVEFTFLFAAPVLWVIHSVLAAVMDATMFAIGVVGDFGGGLIGWASTNWIPLWQNHWPTYVLQVAVGLAFTALYFVIFRYMILRFNYITPGREATDKETELINKREYKAKKAMAMAATGSADAVPSKKAADPYSDRAAAYLEYLGGKANISELNSCATRLRVTVNDPAKVASDEQFKADKALGIVRKGNAIQVVVGLDVPQVLDQMTTMMGEEEAGNNLTQNAALISDSLGAATNIKKVETGPDQLVVTVDDPKQVDSEDIFKSLSVGIQSVTVDGNKVTIVVPDAVSLAKLM